MTLSLWACPSDTSGKHVWLGKQPSGTAGDSYPGNFDLRCNDAAFEGLHQTNYSTAYSTYTVTNGVTANIWKNYAMRLVPGTVAQLLIDGTVAYNGSPGQFGMTNNQPVLIGRRKDGYFFNGSLDEIRISSVARSTNWLWAEWFNVASNAAFVRVGTVQPVLPPLPRIATMGATNLYATSATLLADLSATGGTPAAVYVVWGTNSAAWDHVLDCGVQPAGSISVPIAGLWPEQTYAFTFMASNAAGAAWAQSSLQFTNHRHGRQ